MLGRLGVDFCEGIYCSSTSIRKGYKGDVTHSAIADQWDYEVKIRKEDRKVETLKSYVKTIWKIVKDAEGIDSCLFFSRINSNNTSSSISTYLGLISTISTKITS